MGVASMTPVAVAVAVTVGVVENKWYTASNKDVDVDNNYTTCVEAKTSVKILTLVTNNSERGNKIASRTCCKKVPPPKISNSYVFGF